MDKSLNFKTWILIRPHYSSKDHILPLKHTSNPQKNSLEANIGEDQHGSHVRIKEGMKQANNHKLTWKLRMGEKIHEGTGEHDPKTNKYTLKGNKDAIKEIHNRFNNDDDEIEKNEKTYTEEQVNEEIDKTLIKAASCYIGKKEGNSKKGALKEIISDLNDKNNIAEVNPSKIPEEKQGVLWKNKGIKEKDPASVTQKTVKKVKKIRKLKAFLENRKKNSNL